MSYLDIDLLNKPFIYELLRKVSISKTISSSDKNRIKKIIKKNNFINKLEEKFNKKIYGSNDIKEVLKYLEGLN